MVAIILGLIIGVVMGLTGAGGALIAIPLFIEFLNMDLKMASVYSLLAVVIAALLNLYQQRKNADYKLAIIILFFSTVGSLATVSFKKLLPDIFISILLSIVSIYALYAIWFSSKSNSKSNLKSALNSELDTNKDKILSTLDHLKLTGPVGLILGALTTFTGLGGGVLMMPIFINLYHFESAKAVATSLLAVALSSLVSLIIQMQNGFQINFDFKLGNLVFGIILAVFVIKIFLKKISSQRASLVRQVVFSIVVVVAILKLFNH